MSHIRPYPKAALLGGLCALSALFLAVGLHLPALRAAEAGVYESICRQIAANTTEGRQALVSSAWWPPLPVLVRLPLVALLPATDAPAASIAVSAGAGALCVLLMAMLGRDWHLGRARAVLVAGLSLNPWFLRHAVDGSTHTTTLVFVLLTAHTLMRWLATDSLRYMVTFGLCAGLLLLTSFELTPWLLAGVLLLVILRRGRDGNAGEKRAALLLAVLPAVYLFGLWILMNWLIMGDGFFFLRSLFRASLWRARVEPTGMLLPLDIGCVAFGLVVLLLALFRRDTPGACLAAMAAAPLLLALGFERVGLLWSRAPLLFVLHPLALVAFGVAWGDARIRRGGMPPAAWLAGLVLVAAPGAQYALQPPAPSAADDAGHVRHAVECHVAAQSPYALVFACGYESYRLLGHDGGRFFHHALDFNFNETRNDYRGHALYLLVHAPTGRAAMDSIHWQYDDIYALGSRGTLYADDWDGWRLFEIIQAPVDRPPSDKPEKETP